MSSAEPVAGSRNGLRNSLRRMGERFRTRPGATSRSVLPPPTSPQSARPAMCQRGTRVREKNGNTFVMIRSPTRLVCVPS